ncbi:MAG: hypothetical protein J2P30_01535 [Actinobacteria bacterium]|nr:hypothetical protein [Actinomycetota bacterium]
MGGLPRRIGLLLGQALAERRGWDGLPGLYLIRLEHRQQTPTLIPVPVPAELWALPEQHPGMRTLDVLAGMADTIASPDGRGRALLQGIGNSRGGTLHGVAFRHEGYGLTNAAAFADPAFRRQAAADAYAHRIGDRPDATELRMMYAVDAAGYTYALMHPRGGRPEKLIVPPDDPDLQPTGYVLESLDRLLEALCGVPCPQRAKEEIPE